MECTCPSGDGSLRPCPVHFTPYPTPKGKYVWVKRDGDWILVFEKVEVHTPSETITVEVSEEREVDDGV